MRPPNLSVVVIALLASVPSLARAGDAFAEVSTALASSDPAVLSDGVNRVKGIIIEQPRFAITSMRKQWLDVLRKNKRYAEIEELTALAIPARPFETADLETVMQFRVEALLRLGKSATAMSEAKSLLNLSSLSQHPLAVNLFYQALLTRDNGNADAATRFRREQADGTKADAVPPGAGSVLASISIDGSAYEKAAAELAESADARRLGVKEETEFRRALGRGNLFLLADNPNAASDAFNKALSLATTEKQKTDATDAMFRLKKARDGILGPASTEARKHQPPKS